MQVAQSYSSGSVTSGSMTFGGNTLASQGINPGSYVYNIAGSTETITLRTAAQLPKPATLALMGLGLACIGYKRRQLKKA